MQREVTKSWALFLGIGTIMIAHGLQMQVMGIRSVNENFNLFCIRTYHNVLPALHFEKWNVSYKDFLTHCILFP